MENKVLARYLPLNMEQTWSKVLSLSQTAVVIK